MAASYFPLSQFDMLMSSTFFCLVDGIALWYRDTRNTRWSLVPLPAIVAKGVAFLLACLEWHFPNWTWRPAACAQVIRVGDFQERGLGDHIVLFQRTGSRMACVCERRFGRYFSCEMYPCKSTQSPGAWAFCWRLPLDIVGWQDEGHPCMVRM